MKTLQDRLRDYSFEGDTWILQQEAADRIDALEAEANRLSEHATVIRNQRDEALAKLAALTKDAERYRKMIGEIK